MYTRKTDAELELLAQDIVAGHVWSNYDHNGDPEELSMTFLPIAFLDKEDIAALKADNLTFAYEYLREAGPRSVNGMPVFFSVKFLDYDDQKRLHERVQEIAKLRIERLDQAQAAAT